jgi:hypothetical protein
MIIRDTQQRTMIQFRAMTDSEFLPYLDELYRGYADEQVKAGFWPAE